MIRNLITEKTEVVMKSRYYSDNCCLCGEFLTGTFPKIYNEFYPIKSRICLETNDFVVIPSISPIVKGHLLVLPKWHISNMSMLSGEELPLFLNIVKRIISFDDYKDGYFVFEHGVGDDGFSGCGIDHAHLHIMPMKAELTRRIMARVALLFCVQACDKVEGFFCNRENNGSYLLYGDSLARMFYCLNEYIPSQFIRKIIAEEMGIDSGDWKLCNGRKEFFETIDMF